MSVQTASPEAISLSTDSQAVQGALTKVLCRDRTQLQQHLNPYTRKRSTHLGIAQMFGTKNIFVKRHYLSPGNLCLPKKTSIAPFILLLLEKKRAGRRNKNPRKSQARRAGLQSIPTPHSRRKCRSITLDSLLFLFFFLATKRV